MFSQRLSEVMSWMNRTVWNGFVELARVDLELDLGQDGPSQRLDPFVVRPGSQIKGQGRSDNPPCESKYKNGPEEPGVPYP